MFTIGKQIGKQIGEQIGRRLGRAGLRWPGTSRARAR